MTTKARVTVMIDVPAESSWGGDCTLEQVFKQARENVLGQIRARFERVGVNIIGEPEIIAIFVNEK